MRHRHLFFVLILTIFFLGGARLQDQAPQNPVLSKYRFVPKNDAQMQKIAYAFSVEHRNGNAFEILVPVPETKTFLELAPGAELLQADISARFNALDSEHFAGFHTFDSVGSELRQIADKYPDLVTLDKYGESMEGRPLHVLRLLTKSGLAKKKQVAITSATHGNEISTVEVVFGILNHIIQNRESDTRIKNILDNYELYFLPVINPDGYVRKERFANGIDPNRDYPWPQKPDRNPNPCIKNVMAFFASHEIKGSIDYHSSGGMIMYPWAYTTKAVEANDKKFFHDLTGKMAKLNGYVYGPIATTIYIAPGSSADYYYWKFGTKSLGIELSREGSSSLIPSLVKENLNSTLTFIEGI